MNRANRICHVGRDKELDNSPKLSVALLVSLGIGPLVIAIKRAEHMKCGDVGHAETVEPEVQIG